MTCRPRFASYALVGVLFLAMAGCNDDDDTPVPAADTTAPTVSSTSPANAATGVSTTGAITATFSEAVSAATVTASTFTVTVTGGAAVTGTVTLSASGTTATFAPAALAYQTSYTATLTTGIKDLAGNALAGHTWSFTTAAPPDTTAPTVSSVNPADASVDVSTTGAITATFSEAVNAATVTSATFTVVDSAGNPAAGAVTVSGSTATFTPNAGEPLTHLTTYTATLTTGIKDAAGNPLGASRSWTFTTVDTATPVLSARDLNAWVDDGRVNGTGANRVVVLDIATLQTTYDAGHVPGSQRIANIYQNRQEGPAVDVNMVLDGTAMDALVKGAGIDANTIVVFTTTVETGGGSILGVTRAYWMFRYWGFPREQLKVLDGLNGAWTTAGYATSTQAPTVAASTYSVAGHTLRRDLRASLTEMMAVAADNDANTVILDGRSAPTAGSYSGAAGTTEGVFGNAMLLPTGTKDWTVFEGHMRGAQALAWGSMYNSTGNTFKSATELETLFATVGITSATTTYPHCRTGVIASMPFFALDAILGWNAVLYDGSWSQWGQLSGDAANGGQLAADSPWRTDLAALNDVITYNHSATTAKNVEILTLNGTTCSGTLLPDGTSVWSTGTVCTPPEDTLTSAQGNQIEDADAVYTTVTTD